MFSQRFLGRLAALAVGGMVVLSALPAAHAKEKVQEFLDALRRARMFDVAEEYLEALGANPTVAEEVKQTIPFELGKTIISKCDTISDTDTRLKELAKARGKFEEFIAKSPAHKDAADAQAQIGMVSVSRGKAYLEMSRKPANAKRKDALLVDARKEFLQAQTLYDTTEKRLDEEYKKLKAEIEAGKEGGPGSAERRERLDNLVVSRLQAATVTFEHSKAYDKGSKEHGDLIKAASAKFHDIYERYRKKAVGLFAGMFEGRCHQDLGDYKRALGIYESLLLQPDEPPIFAEIKGKTLALALECWISDDQKLYDKAVDEGEKWLAKATPEEKRSEWGMGIHYFTAVGTDKQIEALQASNANPNDVKKRVNALVNSATFLTRFTNEYRKQAQALVGKYRKAQAEGEPTTFEEARDASKTAIDAMSAAKNFIDVSKKTQNAEMMAQIPDKEKEVRESRLAALKYCKLALELRDEESAIEEINLIRFQYAFLLYEMGRLPDAAVMGEFLSRSYPKSGALARQSGMVALHSYLGEYNQNKSSDKSFEVNRLVGIAEHIAKTWPTDAESDTAWMLLADLAIREKNLAQAAAYLDKIPAESPRRSEADLKAGQALWGAYVASSRLPEEDRPPKDVLDNQVVQAQQVLEKGIERMRGGLSDPSQATYNLIAAEMTLAQIYVGAGAPDKAVARLETADSGPLAMVRAKNATVNVGNFPEETYKAALQAYVGTQQLDKAEAVMSELEALVADKPDAAAQLTKIYIKLGQDLEDRVKRLQDQKQLEELSKVLQTFEAFLTRIKDRPTGNTFNSLNWVAETFLRLASGLDTGDGDLPPEAKGYYEKAVATYETMKARGKSEPSFLPSPQYATGLDIRVARCQRSLGNYKVALDLLAEILKDNPKILEAQLEAAYTYQAWANAEKKLSYYKSAIEGGRKDKTTKVALFWGWAMLGSMVQRDPKYDALFHESRYNLADCHFRMSALQQSPDKEKTLVLAERDIVATYKLMPKMGGEEQYAKYNRLLKTIQTAMGKKSPTGLKGLEKPDAKPTASASAAPAKK